MVSLVKYWFLHQISDQGLPKNSKLPDLIGVGEKKTSPFL